MKDQYKDQYSEGKFWRKVKTLTKDKMVTEVVSKALLLYYTAKQKETPLPVKTAIFGALAYFISPVDVIPDTIPIVGYSDDIGVIAAVLTSFSAYISESVKRQTSAKIEEWLA